MINHIKEIWIVPYMKRRYKLMLILNTIWHEAKDKVKSI